MTGARRSGRRRLAIGAVLATTLVLAASCRFIPVGGPANVFGNDPTRAGVQPGMWAAINGPYSNHADGDPYATKCASSPATATRCDGAGPSSTYTNGGYVWGIEVPAGAIGIPVTVAIYDPSMSGNAALLELVQNQMFATSFELFNASGSSESLDMTEPNSMSTLGKCSAGPGSKVFAAGSTESVNAWYTLCTFTPTLAGTYPLRVKSSDIPGVVDAGGGYNSFSIRATSPTGPGATVASLWMSSFTLDQSVASNRLYLTSIAPTEAGRTLTLDVYDIGDGTTGSTPATIQVLAPPGGAPAVRPGPLGGSVSCKYNSVGSANAAPPTPDTSADCRVVTQPANSSVGIYNNKWLRLSITIPTTYTCTTDCWWTLSIDRGDGLASLDRTVLQVTVS